MIARYLIVSVGFVLCAGFNPLGSCARGCRAGCGGASRVSVRSSSHLDDLARIPRYSPRPVVVPGPGVGRLGSELGHTTTALDDAVRALPEVEGSVSSIARAPSQSGVSLATDTTTRTFGRDYGRAAGKLDVTPAQHDKLLDAFDLAQKVVEQLGDDTADEPTRSTLEAMRYARVGIQLDRRLAGILDPQQYAQLIQLLGTPEVIARRLAIERPIVRAELP